VIKVRPPSLQTSAVPGRSEVGLLKPGSRLISYIQPAQNKPLLEKLAEQRVTVFAMDQVRAGAPCFLCMRLFGQLSCYILLPL
jgi:H+-translocating NAD(P) transhydrogenase